MNVDIDIIKRFLDDLLYPLKDDAIVCLTLVEQPDNEDDEPIENTWHGTVERLFGGELQVIVENLEPTARLFISNRSDTDILGLVVPGEAEDYTWLLQRPEGCVSVALFSPVGDAATMFDYEMDLPIPGIGGVTVADDKEQQFDADDTVIDTYIEEIDRIFAEEEADDGQDQDDEDNDDDDPSGGSVDASKPDGGDGDGPDSADRRGGEGDDRAGAGPKNHRHADDDNGSGEGAGETHHARQDAEAFADLQIASAPAASSGADPVSPHNERAIPDAGDHVATADDADAPWGGDGEEPVPEVEFVGGPVEVEGTCDPEQGQEGFEIGVGAASYYKNNFTNQMMLAAKDVKSNTKGALADLMTFLTFHQEGPKTGNYFLQGRVEKVPGATKLHRIKPNMRDLCIAGLDIDAGTMSFDELKVRLKGFGYTVGAYTTHSHMKTRDKVERHQILRAMKNRTIDGPIPTQLLRLFLGNKKGQSAEMVETVEIIKQDQNTIYYEHAPWPKFRIFFPLAMNFDPTAPGAQVEWAERIRGLAEAIGVPHDEACKDVSRLFYMARHEPGREYRSYIFWGDTLLDIYKIPRVKKSTRRRSDNPFTDFGREVATGEGDKMLRKALAIIGDKLDLPAWLEKYAPECLTGEERDNGGVFTVCPHYLWEGKHSTTIEESPQGSYALAPGDEGTNTAVWHCSHGSCHDEGFDRLDRLALVLENVDGATVESMFDPECLILSEHDPEASELLEQFTATSVPANQEEFEGEERKEEEIVDHEHVLAEYEADTESWSTTKERLAPTWNDLESDVKAQICERLVKKTRMTKSAIKKEIDALCQSKSKKIQAKKQQELVASGEDWREKLSYVQIKIGDELVDMLEPSPFNVSLMLHNNSNFAGKIAFNNLRERPFVLEPLPWDQDVDNMIYPREWNKFDKSSLRTFFHAPGTADQMRVRMEDITHGLDAFLNAHRYDPVREYLRECRDNWDGKPRIDGWLTHYCGADDTPINRAMGAKWMISAVARQAEPGCQAKYVLITEGDQDAGKSKAFSILGGEWFTEDVKDFHNKDSQQIVATNWIIELPELGAIKGARAVEEVKAFISKTSEEFRSPYGEYNVKRPRQCIFAGTTNEEEYLTDPTGNVRFWPVRCHGQIRADELLRDRDHLWGEAVARYEADERWWFDKDDPEEAILMHELRDVQESREVEDPLAELVRFHLTMERPVLNEHGKPVAEWEEVSHCDYVKREAPLEGFSIAEFLDLLKMDYRNRRGTEIRVGGLLKKAGYEKRRAQDGGDRSRRYFLVQPHEEAMAA